MHRFDDNLDCGPPAAESARRLDEIRAAIRHTLERCRRPPDGVTLIAVTKTFPPETILEAHDAGQLDFGENKVQEAEPKILRLRGLRDLRWHFIGHLQSNKARRAAELFDMVHSVDSVKLARRLDKACRELEKRLPVLVQVDLGQESTKFGASRETVPEIVEAVHGMANLRLDGLMTLPPWFENPEDTRPYFAELREIRDRLESGQPGCLGRGHLSMGMTHDFEVAIEEGATMVRIGTAIFGERKIG